MQDLEAQVKVAEAAQAAAAAAEAAADQSESGMEAELRRALTECNRLQVPFFSARRNFALITKQLFKIKCSIVVVFKEVQQEACQRKDLSSVLI